MNQRESPPRKRPVLCVFCGSSLGIDPAYAEATRRFGALAAGRGFDIVFGGGGVGLMGELATAAIAHGAHVLGVIPDFLRKVEAPIESITELVVTPDLNTRKTRMFEAAGGFAILAGGLGTLDELTEALTGAQLHTHTKPIVIVNTKGFFDPFLAAIDHAVAQGFADGTVRGLFHVVATPEDAVNLLAETYASK